MKLRHTRTLCEKYSADDSREFTKYRVRGNILVDSTNECVTH